MNFRNAIFLSLLEANIHRNLVILMCHSVIRQDSESMDAGSKLVTGVQGAYRQLTFLPVLPSITPPNHLPPICIPFLCLLLVQVQIISFFTWVLPRYCLWAVFCS